MGHEAQRGEVTHSLKIKQQLSCRTGPRPVSHVLHSSSFHKPFHQFEFFFHCSQNHFTLKLFTHSLKIRRSVFFYLRFFYLQFKLILIALFFQMCMTLLTWLKTVMSHALVAICRWGNWSIIVKQLLFSSRARSRHSQTRTEGILSLTQGSPLWPGNFFNPKLCHSSSAMDYSQVL